MEQDAKILTQGESKRLLSYNKEHGMNFVKNMCHKHYSFVHEVGGGAGLLQKRSKITSQKKLHKKEKIFFHFKSYFFLVAQPYNKKDHTQQVFLEDLVLYIAKGYCPLFSIENPWGR
jgi:hypothetical protein